MSLRRQLPVYSPLPLHAIARGLRQLLAPSAARRRNLGETIRSHLGARRVLLLDSGTHALDLALRAVARARPGLPVALPAYCCYDIATAADGAGVRVLLYDVSPTTLGPDFASLERVVAAGVSGIVVVHLYGIPVDLGAVTRMAAAAGVPVIEDAAQGAGGSFAGKPLGAHGSLAVLSFGRGKGITAGRGGALVANDARGEDLLNGAGIVEPAHGRGGGDVIPVLAQWLLARPSMYGIPAAVPGLHLGETIYHPVTEPRGMSDFAVGVLDGTWGLAEGEAEVRRRNAAAIGGRLAGKTGVRVPAVPAGGVAGYLRFPVVVEPDGRWESKHAGDQTAGYPRSLSDLGEPFRGRLVGAGEPCAGARHLAARLITLPSHSRSIGMPA